ncbi:MAG: serine/threonine-protein kinase [Polyangiaceae bacterium]
MRPDKIGPYRVLGVYAEDALTITLRAFDPGLSRALLVKTARAPVEPSAVRNRLLHEAKIAGPTSFYPGVLTLHGLVRKDDAVHLLFEDVDGPRLFELSAKVTRLPPAQAIAIALGIAEALAHLHARGIVHGGLQPSRVALTKSGGVKLVDLSTARAAGAEAPDDEPPRPPEYMAPEQILAEAEGPRADVFSAGVVLFELLAGERPWADPPKPPPNPDVLAPAEISAEERHALAHRIRNAPPPPLVTTEGPATATLARIVSRSLAKDPADRYEDAGALAEELRDALREVSIEPASALVARALAAGDFVPDRPPVRARGPAEIAPPDVGLRRLVQQLGAVLGLIVFGSLITEWSRAGERPAPPPSETKAGERGYLRVLAQPWAEVAVDGERIDTTPMARLIPVAPGRHFVTFTHPNAPEEKRTVNVVTNQTVLVDVTMRVERPHKDAGPDAAPIDETP